MNKEQSSMKSSIGKRIVVIAIFVTACMALMFIAAPPQPVAAQQIGDQQLLKLRFANNGVGTAGSGILQTGDVSSLSAAVATATLTKVVTAPTSGSTYIRGVVVEKSTGAGGTFTIQTGTGTNCGTGTAVLLGPITNPPIQQYYLGVLAPAGKDVCIQTDAATTSVRVQYS
jgi:hypothetical protein